MYYQHHSRWRYTWSKLHSSVRVPLTVHVRLHPQANEKCSRVHKASPGYKFLINDKLWIPSLLQSVNRVPFVYSPRTTESAYCAACTTGMPILLCRSCSALVVHSQHKHLSVVLFTMTKTRLPAEFPVATRPPHHHRTELITSSSHPRNRLRFLMWNSFSIASQINTPSLRFLDW